MDNNHVNMQPSTCPTPWTMYDYAEPTLVGAKSSIVKPTLVAHNFKFKLNTIQMLI